MNDSGFVRYSPPMERTAYGRPIAFDARPHDDPAMDAMGPHPRLSDPPLWQHRPLKGADGEAGPMFDLATTTPPEKGAMHAGYPVADGGLDMRLDGPFSIPRDPSWNFTPDLDLHQFSTFSAALSPYSSISPYVPAADFSPADQFVPQETYISLPLDRQYGSLSSSASSSSLASSLGYDRQSPVESATSCGSSGSARFSNPLALTAIHDGKPASPSRPDSAQRQKPVKTIKTEEDLHDYFDNLFKKSTGDEAANGSPRSRNVSGGDSSTPVGNERSHVEGLGDPIPLYAPSPVPGRAMRPAVLARQHSLQHTFNGRPRSDSTFSTSSFDSTGSSLYGLQSPLGALALSESSSSQGYFPPQPIQPLRTIHPLAISSGPSSPASPASMALPLRATHGMAAPSMAMSMSLSALSSSKMGTAPPLTPRLRALQASEGAFAPLPQEGDADPLAQSSSAGRPRAFSNPTSASTATGGSSRVGRTRHSRNGSVVLAAAGRQVQSVIADDDDAGDETFVKRRRSVRISPTLSSTMTPPGSPGIAQHGLLGSPIAVADVMTTPGGTVKLRRGSERRATGGLMDSVMARSESTPTLSALATSALDPSSGALTSSVGKSPRSRARIPGFTPTVKPVPLSPMGGSSLRRAQSARSPPRAREDQGSPNDGEAGEDEDDEQIQQDSEGRLICGMLLPGMTEPCQRAFKRKEHRKRHQRQHTNEKPYPCPKCGMRFTRTDNCNQHIRTHENKDGRNSKMLRARQERESRGLIAFAEAQVLAASTTSGGSPEMDGLQTEVPDAATAQFLLQQQQHQQHEAAFQQQQHHLAMAQAAMAAQDHDAAYFHHQEAQKVNVAFQQQQAQNAAFLEGNGLVMQNGNGFEVEVGY